MWHTSSRFDLLIARELQLICLVLPDGYSNLLQPKSIWNAEGTPKDFSLVEHILHLEPLDVSLKLHIFYSFNKFYAVFQ